MAEGTTSVQHRVSELVMVTLRPQKGTLTTMSVMTMCCMCIVKRTGRLCGNRARYDNFFGDRVCGNHTRSTALKKQQAPSECECCICQTDIRDREAHIKTHCGHDFHTHCLDAWIKSGQPSSHACPLCRRDVSYDKLRLDFILRSQAFPRDPKAVKEAKRDLFLQFSFISSYNYV
jgi:hypothetical protein